MSKPNIKKLKYPLWFNIVFAILTLGIPLGLFVYEGLSAANTQKGTIFKLSFMAILVLVIAWWFIYHFVIKKYIDKLTASQAQLEHDYAVEIGNPDKVKYLWYNNEKILTIINIIGASLYGTLAGVIALGVQAGLMKVKTVLFLVSICYVVAYTIKFMLLITRKEAKDEKANGTEQSSKECSTEDNSKH